MGERGTLPGFNEVVIDLTSVNYENLTWKYIGEGNRHFVISMPDLKLAFRFGKSDCPTEIEDEEDYYRAEDDEYRRLLRSLAFHCGIIAPYFCFNFGTLPVVGKVSKSFVQHIRTSLGTCRPRLRMSKSIRVGFVEIYPLLTSFPTFFLRGTSNHLPSDEYRFYMNEIRSLSTSDNVHSSLNQHYSEAPVFSVEIKPKQGWVPIPDRHFAKCTFCMNQYLKIKGERFVTPTKYCPLDMFSGCESRIKYALKCLLQSPQNNLKIFRNGELVFGGGLKAGYLPILKEWFGDEKDVVENFCLLICTALLFDFAETFKEDLLTLKKVQPERKTYNYWLNDDTKLNELASILHRSNNVCDWSYQRMKKNCVLNKILELQKLHTIGLDNVFAYYNVFLKNLSEEYYISELVPFDQLFPFPDRIFRNQQRSLRLNVSDSYLLAAAANDCSLFISTKQVDKVAEKSMHHFLYDMKNCAHAFSVGIVDIGPKPVSTIVKHVQQRDQMFEAALKFFNLYSS